MSSWEGKNQVERTVLISFSHCRITPQLYTQKSRIIHQISNQRLVEHPRGILVFEPATKKAWNGVCMKNNCSDCVSSSLENKLLRRKVIKLKWAEKGKLRIVVHDFSQQPGGSSWTLQVAIQASWKRKNNFTPKASLVCRDPHHWTLWMIKSNWRH